MGMGHTSHDQRQRRTRRQPCVPLTVVYLQLHLVPVVLSEGTLAIAGRGAKGEKTIVSFPVEGPAVQLFNYRVRVLSIE